MQNNDSAKADALSKELNNQLQSSLQNHKAKASVINQTIEKQNLDFEKDLDD